MNNKSYIKYLLAFLLVLSACTGNQFGSEQKTGYVDISVSHDTSLEIVPVVKSSNDLQFPVTLTIFDATGAVYQVIEDFSQTASALNLPTGSYTAEAVMGVETEGGVSYAPCYKGRIDFVVRANMVSSVEIVCRLTSVKVTVSVSEQIKSNFTYSLELTDGHATETFTNDISEHKELYFHASESLSWVLNLTNINGESFVLNDSYADVSSGQHYNLVFSLEESSQDKIGAGEFKITVDDSLNDPKVHDVTLVIDKSAPVIDGPSAVVKSVSDICSEGIYVVSSVLPISSLSITHSDSELLAQGLPQNLDLFTDRSSLGILADAGVSIEIFAGTTAQPFVGDETNEVRLNFNALFDRLPVGEYGFTINSVNLTGKDQAMDAAVSVTSSLAQPSLEPWAMFIYVKGRWTSASRPEGMKLQYRLSGAESWTDFVPSDSAGEIFYDDNTSSYRAFICALQPSSSYEVRAVSDREETVAQSKSTSAAGQLYNMNFDIWDEFKRSNAGTLEKKTYFPYPSNATNAQKVWDTANPGTSVLGITPTTPETTDVIKGKAVRMQSMYKTKFAAGNIYTGQFDAIDIGSMGAELDWGTPFTGKPVGLKGWYKYAPKEINYTGGSYGNLKGQMDRCQIQVALFTGWTGPFHVKTGDNKFVDFSTANTSIIAHNALETGSTNGKWAEFTMYLGYRKNNFRKLPSYAITTGCASYRGDYFTGGEGSVLLIDEFEYVYDPMKLSAQDRATFFGLFD